MTYLDSDIRFYKMLYCVLSGKTKFIYINVRGNFFQKEKCDIFIRKIKKKSVTYIMEQRQLYLLNCYRH